MTMMQEDLELESKIAQLTSRIDRFKAGSLRNGFEYENGSAQYHPAARSSLHRRGTRYDPIWNTSKPLHRHKSLVFSNPSGNAPDRSKSFDDSISRADWILLHNRHIQLIHSSIYERQVRQRGAFQGRSMNESTTRNRHLTCHLFQNNRPVPAMDELETRATSHQTILSVGKIRFLIIEGGSKLKRIHDERTATYETPKRAKIGGIVFHRSKRGDLYRAGSIKSNQQTGVSQVQKPCQQFSSSGFCSKGPACRYIHDAQKVAMCKDFLQKGECPAGEYCDLSHHPTPERVPTCVHFQRGSCTNATCPYSHTRLNPAAPVCKAFAIYGYCAKGTSCESRHAHECPVYTNKGSCRNAKCRLPHIDRAGQLRKAAAAADVGTDIDDQMSDISSDSETESDDYDFEMDETELNADLLNHELSQQVDYVHL